MRVIQISLSEETFELLQQLGNSDRFAHRNDPIKGLLSPAEIRLHNWSIVTEVLTTLIAHAADGVRRPGAWERAWLNSVFGDF